MKPIARLIASGTSATKLRMGVACAIAILFTTQLKALPCVSQVGMGPISAKITYKNICKKPIAFVVERSGSKPTHNSTYWMLPNETRLIVSDDTLSEIKSESDVVFGGGPKGDVELVRRPSVPKIDELVLINHHQVRTLVHVELRLNFIPPTVDGKTGKPYATKTATLLIKPADGAGAVFDRLPTDVFSGYTVVSIKSEDEPIP